MKINVEIEGNEFKVKINDLPHLCIKDRIIGYQAWIEENKWYKIEYYLKNQTILTEYDNIEKWMEIIKQLDIII